MNKGNKYEALELEVILFEAEDVILTSDNNTPIEIEE